MEIKVDKCSSYTDLGSCEFYSTYKFTDPCEKIMTLTEGPWAAIFHTTPPLTCPIKKGSYALRQSAVKPSYLSLANMSNNVYWKFSMKLWTGKRVVACVKGGIEKSVIRNKSKTKSN
uniref:Carbamoyl-phosphate synthase large chain n=1 Tax=Lygus hesperus TaxID=30085 RepID=A0A0A9XBI1_LYGHE